MREIGARRRWLAAAIAIVVLGVAGSLAAALLWSASVHTRERQAFQTSAADVSGTLETQLRRDTDFVRSVRAVLALQPNLSASGFQKWLALLEEEREQPAGYGALVVRSIPASQLAAFQARRDADPAFRKLVGGQPEPVAADGSSRYCLLAAGTANVLYDPEVARLLQADWCDPTSLLGGYEHNGTTRAQFTQAITDDGQYGVYSINLSGVTSLIVEVAAYRPGTPLKSVAQRRDAVTGWVLGSFDITSLMQSALGGTRGLAVTLYHSNPGLVPEFIGRAGSAGAHRFTNHATVQMDGIWTVDVAGAPPVSGLSAQLQGVIVLIGGVLLSLLLATLMWVLARSRDRAIGMVREKTGELRHQAMHDALTGLPNRVLALDRVEQMLARARRQQLPVAALYVDIDGFKHVNDSFGHAAGDALLRIVARRLESVVREGDTAARLGGDEFVVLVEGATLDAGPELVAERLLEVLREPYDMLGEVGRELTVTASIGIAFGLRGTPDELLRDADIALYEAKGAGRDRYVLFNSGMETAFRDRTAIQMDLREALERDEFFLLYQPTFDLQSESVIGVEALIRWRHPTRGVLAPADFMPVAETTGLIVPIGRWVLGEACRQAAAWRANGQHLGMSVNVSARQLDTDELIEDVREALRENGLEPATLTLEVTETALMSNPEKTAARLRLLKQLGVRVAIDDFGTGYSSLAYLRQFPADALKIDRSFISNLASSKQSTALLHTLVQLGKTLEIETLAEGIEDLAQLQTLQREQCDHGQGFLFSRPLDVDAVEAFFGAPEVPSAPQPAHG
ncbi:MAG TPA: bifunctional diguanylate cyclase/phosphodiesterase [Solirubrobacteraceae bacterium]|jgi:diguanylate cyclase (GGDEF)-like protein|nr:bifunctional diguanylate cyclase/phosphodiesterase [Solirubrobacteraceae bacterium]